MNNNCQQIIYKNYIVNIPHIQNESHHDFEMRKWYILKNLHLTNEYVKNNETAQCSLEELTNFSKIHIQKDTFNCKYDEKTMNTNGFFESNLYIQPNNR